MRGLEKWNDSTLLLTSFMPFCKNRRVHNLLCTEMSQWDFNELTCSDLWDLQNVAAKLKQWDPDEVKTNIWNDLEGLLKKSLAYYDINLEQAQPSNEEQ